jgi:hypothetical protein
VSWSIVMVENPNVAPEFKHFSLPRGTQLKHRDNVTFTFTFTLQLHVTTSVSPHKKLG